ncbi:MAG TPA: hypothetical protein VH393_17125 [Ktedonobacterales bacterium]
MERQRIASTSLESAPLAPGDLGGRDKKTPAALVCEHCRAARGEPALIDATHRSCRVYIAIFDISMLLQRARFLVQRLNACGLSAASDRLAVAIVEWNVAYAPFTDFHRPHNPLDPEHEERIRALLRAIQAELGALAEMLTGSDRALAIASGRGEYLFAQGSDPCA